MATEKRLIDANALDALENLDYDYAPVRDGCAWYRTADVWYCIENQPTVDAVEVVRCMDCKAYDKEVGYCEAIGITCGANDFCSYGERKDNG